VTFNKKALAKSYAAKFLLKNDALWVAEEMYSIMEESLQHDQINKQDLTKDFLTDIIEIMNSIDENFTVQVTKEYLNLTIELAGYKKKK
tara:strand:- start:390 stop:656 length:267 start_codon:yes stop_codon:yes gene_type:complete